MSVTTTEAASFDVVLMMHAVFPGVQNTISLGLKPLSGGSVVEFATQMNAANKLVPNRCACRTRFPH